MSDAKDSFYESPDGETVFVPEGQTPEEVASDIQAAGEKDRVLLTQEQYSERGLEAENSIYNEIRIERRVQVLELGYTHDHDRIGGVEHLVKEAVNRFGITWSPFNYPIERKSMIEAAALLVAALDVDSHTYTSTSETVELRTVDVQDEPEPDDAIEKDVLAMALEDKASSESKADGPLLSAGEGSPMPDDREPSDTDYSAYDNEDSSRYIEGRPATLEEQASLDQLHAKLKSAPVSAEELHDRPTLQDDITHVLNRYSAENESGTPDFILAEYLMACLQAYNTTIRRRAEWRGKPLDQYGYEQGQNDLFNDAPLAAPSEDG